jgi:hypothetical protein
MNEIPDYSRPVPPTTTSNSTGPVRAGALLGMPVFVNETLPPNTAELRTERQVVRISNIGDGR